MGVHRPAHGCAHLRRPGAPPLRIELDHRCLDHHTTRTKAARGIPLPTPVPSLSRKRDNDLRAPAPRVETACPSVFPGAIRSCSRTYAAGIATRLADRDLDLLEERLGPRIDACSTTAGPPRPDPKFFALISRHRETIGHRNEPAQELPSIDRMK